MTEPGPGAAYQERMRKLEGVAMKARAYLNVPTSYQVEECLRRALAALAEDDKE